MSSVIDQYEDILTTMVELKSEGDNRSRSLMFKSNSSNISAVTTAFGCEIASAGLSVVLDVFS